MQPRSKSKAAVVELGEARGARGRVRVGRSRVDSGDADGLRREPRRRALDNPTIPHCCNNSLLVLIYGPFPHAPNQQTCQNSSEAPAEVIGQARKHRSTAGERRRHRWRRSSWIGSCKRAQYVVSLYAANEESSPRQGSEPSLRDTLKVSLVEAGDLSKVRDWTPPPGTFSNRVSSITNASQAFLGGAQGCVVCFRVAVFMDGSRDRRVGTRRGRADMPDRGNAGVSQIASLVAARGRMVILQVWDGLSDARITFSMQDDMASRLPGMDSQTQMARLTENLNLQRALLRHLGSTSSIELIDKVKVQSIERETREGGGWPLVHLSDGRVLRPRLLVSPLSSASSACA